MGKTVESFRIAIEGKLAGGVALLKRRIEILSDNSEYFLSEVFLIINVSKNG